MHPLLWRGYHIKNFLILPKVCIARNLKKIKVPELFNGIPKLLCVRAFEYGNKAPLNSSAMSHCAVKFNPFVFNVQLCGIPVPWAPFLFVLRMLKI